MSTNLASILVGLGYDLSALEKGAPEAFRLVNEHTMGMSAEMKRASREGAESFRLIDESLGIHISRPLTRILTQEFPSLASGLQAVLGAGVVGALGVAAFDFIGKGVEKVEAAEKAEDALADASRKLGETFSDAMQSYEKANKLRSLSGLDKTLFQIDSSSIEEGRKKIDGLAAAMQKESAASAEAAKWYVEFLAAVGEGAHAVISSQSTLEAEGLEKQFKTVLQTFDDLSKLDALRGTHDSAKYIADQITEAQKSLTSMTALKITPLRSFFSAFTEGAEQGADLGGDQQIPTQKGYTPAQIANQQAFLDNLTKIKAILDASGNDQKGSENEARKADSAERQLKAQEALAALQKDTGAVLGRFQPQTDPFARLVTEVNGLRMTAENDFRAISESSASMIDKDAAKAALDEIEKKLSSVVRSAQLDKQIADAQASLAKLPSASFAPLASGIAQTPNIPAPTLSLAPQTADLLEVTKVQTDANEAWTKAGAILADIETPQEKYDAGLQVLNELQTQGRLTTEQFAAAQQKLQEQLAESTNKLEELLKKTGDTTAGFQAFYMQLEKSGNQQGAFTYDLLNKGLQGFEDQTVQALTGGKAQWDKYFEGLTQSALKFMLNKGVAQALQLSGLGNALGIPGAGPGIPGLPAADQAVAGMAPSIAGGGAGGAPSAMNLPQMAFAPLSSLMKTFLGIPGEGDNSTSSAGAPPLSPLNLPASAFAPLQGPLNGSLSSSLNGTSGAASEAPLTTAGTQLSLAATQLQAAAAALSTGSLGTSAGTAEGTGGGGTGFSALSLIPGGAYAEGTDYAPGGASLVGEEGPEIVNLPTGSSVTPNASSLRNGPAVHNWYIDARGNEEVGERIQHALSQALPAVEQRAINAVSEIHARTPH